MEGALNRTRKAAMIAASALVAAAAAAVPIAFATSAAAQDEPDPPADSAAATLTGYWHNFDNGSTTMRLSEVPEQYDIVAVAFAEAVASPAGAVDFTLDPVLDYSEDDFKADVAALQAEGRKVVISVGGEKGNVAITDDASADAFADSILSLMDEYGFDGVDIDLEHGIDAGPLETAMRAIHDSAGSELVYTMAPQTIEFQSTTGGYYELAVNTQDILTIVNMQYYNSGSMLGCDGQVYAQGDIDFLTAQACIQLEAGLDPSQVGLGLPAVESAAGSGYVDPSMVNDALACLETLEGCGDFVPDQAYPGMGGAMTWSINWDATNDYNFADTVG